MPLLPHPAPGVRRVARASLPALALGLWVLPLHGGADPEPTRDPWRDALRFEFNTASDEFARRHAAAPQDARLALAHASALQGRQPRTQANIEAAHAVLERVAADPASGDHGVAAELLLGRIAEDHFSPSRPAEARARYEALLRKHSGHPLAEQAAIHLALLDAYPAPGEATLPGPALHERIDALRAGVRSPGVQRELHALQGRLHLESGQRAAALPHLRAARAIGFHQPDRDADVDVSIANLARETGDHALALEHFRAFLRQRPRDARASTVARLITELETAVAVTATAPSPAGRP